MAFGLHPTAHLVLLVVMVQILAGLVPLTRKRKFVEDPVAYITINSVLWPDLGGDRPLDGWDHAMACLGFGDLRLPDRDRRLASVRPLARKPAPPDH